MVEEYQQEWQPPADCGVVVSHLHYDHPTASILKRITAENQVPVLVLADGILEFRNTFANPNVAAGSLFMPLHGHKIACLGANQARHIEAWGNQGKTEVVGLPRLDEVSEKGPLENSDSRKILVVTARQPGFTDQQLDQVRRSLVDVRDWFGRNQDFQGKTLTPVWRLTGGLADKIGVDQDGDPLKIPLIELLPQVDAVISTPSTTVVESMLLGRPTAVLDYTNSPLFISPAWSITASEQIGSVVSELLAPSEARLLFQQTSLQDSLQVNEPAALRMCRLVNALIECRQAALDSSSGLSVPAKVLDGSPQDVDGQVDRVGGARMGDENAIPVSPENQSISLRQLFPGKVGFRANELESLTTEYEQLCQAVNLLHQRIEQQRLDNSESRQQVRIAQRHQVYLADQIKWLRTEIQRLNLALRISRRPTRLHRRLRVRASIAFQRWQYFVEQIQNLSSRRQAVFVLNSLFELTGYPKGNKLPPTIRNHESNPRRNPRIKMWKVRPTNPLLRRMNRSISLQNKRMKARRVMTAV